MLIKWEPLTYSTTCKASERTNEHRRTVGTWYTGQDRKVTGARERVCVGFVAHMWGSQIQPPSPCHAGPFLAHPTSPLPHAHGNPSSKGSVSKKRRLENPPLSRPGRTH